MPVLVKALGYHSHKGGQSAGGLRKIKARLKYLEHGKVHEAKPVGFNGSRDYVSRGEFMEKLEAQPARGVIAHKLVFSMSQDERDRLGVGLPDLVRETMKAWEQSLGRPVTWVGFQHEDKGHPHVHVVVAGYAGGKQVGLYERDINRLRGYAEREKERQASLNRVAPERGSAGRSEREEAARLYEMTRQVRERDFRGR
jgi:hypothetical protein